MVFRRDDARGPARNRVSLNVLRPRRAMLAPIGAALVLAAFTATASAAGSGSLLSWGFNNQGQLGDGTTTSRSIPVDAALPAGVTLTSVAGASFAHSFGVTGDGRLLAWGNNNQGQLGDGTTTDRHAPVFTDLSILDPGETIVAAAGGQDHSYALTSAGRALAWGNNVWGNLGDGTTTNRDTPVLVDLPAGVTLTAVAAGYNHGLGLTADGKILSWGLNHVGQLGDGTTTSHSLPAEVDLSMLDPGETMTAIASMTYHNLALTSLGRVIAWGDNPWGQLGDGTTTARHTPVFVDLPAGVTVASIGVGWDHSLAVTTDGDGLAWGTDDYGQLGDGPPTPVVQTAVKSMVLPAGVELKSVDGGIDHSAALTTDGRVLTFGYGGSGQLGNGTTPAVNATPVFATLPPHTAVTALDVGEYHDLTVANVNIDPTVTIATPADGATYEAGSVVAADYACADPEGTASCVGDVADGAAIDTATLGSHAFTVTATDTAGAQATKTVHYAVVDTTDPGVTITTPADGATYALGQTVPADYACTDLFLDSCTGTVADGGAIDTASVGAKAFTVTGTDTSGNTATKTVHYTVRAATRIVAEPAIVRLGPALKLTLTFSAKLVRSHDGAPIAGRTITFGSTPLGCSAVTNANGVAACGGPVNSVVSLLSLGYNASFAGDADHFPASGRGPVAQIGPLGIL